MPEIPPEKKVKTRKKSVISRMSGPSRGGVRRVLPARLGKGKTALVSFLPVTLSEPSKFRAPVIKTEPLTPTPSVVSSGLRTKARTSSVSPQGKLIRPP